jgi:hypothetical protein
VTITNKIILGLMVSLFLAAKLYFLFNTPKSFAIAAIPAALLLLSSPASAGAGEPTM